MTRRTTAFTLFALFATLAGCSANRRDEPFTKALDVSTDPKLRAGQIAFDRNCNICHPGGSGGYGPSLNSLVLPSWYIDIRVRDGLGAMPAFDRQRLTDEQLNTVVYYVQKLHDL
jgi:mono/diheme cytochrome c family protein